MRKLLIVVVFILFGTAWWQAATTFTEKPIQYKEHLETAEEYEKQEIYYDAILEYKKALEYRPDNMEIYLKMAQDYEKLGDDEAFEQTCNQAINLSSDNEKAVFMLTDYYLEKSDKEDAIALLQRQAAKKKNNTSVKEKLQTLAGGYNFIGGEYEAISNTCAGVMLIKEGGKKGLLDENGDELIFPQYEKLGLFGDNDFAPAKKDGQCFFIDRNNYKRRVTEEKYDLLGIANQGLIPAVKNGKWGYMDENFHELTDFIYDKATPMMDSLAAVKQGEKWAILGKNLKPVTAFEFDDVITDEWGFCSRNGVVFVKSGEKYILIDHKGKQIGTEFFQNATPFISDQPTAIMQNGKWGFLSLQGEKVLECMFDNALGFSQIGYAPVEKNNAWGYIKINGDFIIEPTFQKAKAFNSQGIAPVKMDNVWKLIQLDIY